MSMIYEIIILIYLNAYCNCEKTHVIVYRFVFLCCFLFLIML